MHNPSCEVCAAKARIEELRGSVLWNRLAYNPYDAVNFDDPERHEELEHLGELSPERTVKP